ncbi:uncharacterized protein PHALS_09039 [Plasmopara halstedii]|uniref:Uncharacterized protein n=1 Tax=Plasmopara halstedii TaxID=4781 RepID=A0A0N7L392_PLAHL|nr:uncharacterized protein PHALS_09039 [Plasmopara halstedii]CEG35227.1 hypothetical protein PHALS_09039 [Plasmopara halstedii]|eukprot:XP_024571596.1 hypothetical protein PHALS_09039 [Plasmopara halstedii]
MKQTLEVGTGVDAVDKKLEVARKWIEAEIKMVSPRLSRYICAAETGAPLIVSL